LPPLQALATQWMVLHLRRGGPPSGASYSMDGTTPAQSLKEGETAQLESGQKNACHPCNGIAWLRQVKKEKWATATLEKRWQYACATPPSTAHPHTTEGATRSSTVYNSRQASSPQEVVPRQAPKPTARPIHRMMMCTNCVRQTAASESLTT